MIQKHYIIVAIKVAKFRLSNNNKKRSLNRFGIITHKWMHVLIKSSERTVCLCQGQKWISQCSAETSEQNVLFPWCYHYNVKTKLKGLACFDPRKL